MAVKNRNPIFVIVASLITCGIYSLYWFYQTTRELGEVNHSDTNPVVWTIGLFIPLVNFYFLWKYAGEVEKLVKKRHSQLLLFLACFIFPVVQYITQTELNKTATV